MSHTSTQVLLTGGTVVDGTGAPPRPATDVLLEPDRIVAVGASAGALAAPGAATVDVAGATVLPGLIDAHCH
ncbi:MAG: D-aminoacylase, partial [Acidimicrobiales bacterium]|nr:D-aminoacylase [Acidimicrobiales bacterium]